MNDQKKIYIFLIVLALGAGYVGYAGLALIGFGGISEKQTVLQQKADSITMLQARIDTAKAELAKGSVEDLRRRLEAYRSSLDLLRRLVPESNEVPNLLDDITTRAKIQGVEVGIFSPGPISDGPAPFSTHRWELKVYGHYDQVGEFLSDIASLPRIVVPVDLKIAIAPANIATTYGDTTGGLLAATFGVLTYVKAPQSQEASGGQ